MRIISFVTQKGGAGKTTLAINCAVAAEQNGQKVLILDLDPQASAESWYQDREAETPRLVKIAAWTLPEAIVKAKSAGYDLIMIDTPGRDEPSVTAAVRAADFCIIPCRPTPVDMKATPPTVAAVNRLQKPAVFVLTQTPPRGERVREADAGLAMLGIVSPVRIVARAAYQDAHGAGLSVLEFDPEGKAAAEIAELWSWIAKKIKKLEKVTDAQKKRTSLDTILDKVVDHVPPRGAAPAKPAEKAQEIDAEQAPGVKIWKQTAYLKDPVYEQLRQLAFDERGKMHNYLIEGLDKVFRDRGLPGIAELEKEQT